MNIKKTLIYLLTVCFGCTPAEKEAPQDQSVLQVLATTAMIGDLVAEVGGEYVDTKILIVGDLDPHTYELVKGDDEKFECADLIFCNGLGLEHGYSLKNKLEKSGAIALGDKLSIDTVLTFEGTLDPHIWLDISLFSKLVEPIVEALIQKDPKHKLEYQTRGDELVQKLNAADEKLFATIQSVPSSKRYLVSSHSAFSYFVKRYVADPGENWEHRCIAPEGIAPDSEISAYDLKRVLDFIGMRKIEVLFSEANVNRDALTKIIKVCKDKGMILQLAEKPLYSDSMGEGNSYLQMMFHNMEAFVNASK